MVFQFCFPIPHLWNEDSSFLTHGIHVVVARLKCDSVSACDLWKALKGLLAAPQHVVLFGCIGKQTCLGTQKHQQ